MTIAVTRLILTSGTKFGKIPMDTTARGITAKREPPQKSVTWQTLERIARYRASPGRSASLGPLRGEQRKNTSFGTGLV